MRIRYLGLAVAGSLMFGTWIAVNHAVAAPEPATSRIEATITDNTSVSMSGVTVTLTPKGGRNHDEKRLQISNADGRIGFLGLVSGRWTLTFSRDGYLPVSQSIRIRNGRIYTLRVRLVPEPYIPARNKSGKATSGAGDEFAYFATRRLLAARRLPGLRNGPSVKERANSTAPKRVESRPNVVTMVREMLEMLSSRNEDNETDRAIEEFRTASPVLPRSLKRALRDDEAKAKKSNVFYTIDNFFIKLGTIGPPQSSSNARLSGADRAARINGADEGARRALETGDAREFYRNRAILKRAAAGQYEAEREAAKKILKRLPRKFTSNVALVRDDGTVAADPDPFIRFQISRYGNLMIYFGGGPGGGEAN